MRKIYAPFLFFVLGIVVVYLFLLWQKQTALNVVRPPKKQGAPYSFSLDEAPKNTLRAIVATRSGEIEWTSRTATAPAALTAHLLQQGESLATGKTGKISLDFSGTAEVSFAPETAAEIVQTLPGNLVFKQSSGEAVYTSASVPLAIQVKHLLVRTDGGVVDISVDKETDTVTVKAVRGNAGLGYNDLDYQSMTASLKEGERFTYDDATRTGQTE